MFKRRILLFTLTFLFLGILTQLYGCSNQENPEVLRSNFNHFINEMFVQEVQSDTLSLNYSLANPERYGIKINNPSLGEYSISQMRKGLFRSENYLKRLLEFPYEHLSLEQQLTYDILKSYLEADLIFGNYLYYMESLSPTTGIQAQLPILLAEYNFYTRENIEHYLELLPTVYNYFENIAAFEREKSKKGLFMSDAVANRIIEQCNTFIEDPDNNFLIAYFNEKIALYDGLTETEKETYKAANKEAVLNYIIPAYDMLIDLLLELKGTGKNAQGLYYFPEGQSYYECLVNYKTGSGRSMEEISSLLEAAINESIVDITTLSLTDAEILNKFFAFDSFPLTDPQDILTDLQNNITEDFPEAVPVSCEIKYVHDSLSPYLSPAMYLVPAMDQYDMNYIYINGSDPITLSTIYPTVAHEGYPGHLYQCVYFRNQNPSPIRNLMNFLGYDEGWATYVEMYSYQMSGIDKNLAAFLKANNMLILCVYARTDIGIHYEGWTKEEAIAYIMSFIGEEQIAVKIYETLLEEPAVYLPYAVGCLEILKMKQTAMKELKDDFDSKEFHRFLLDIGPAQFHVINRYFETWLYNFYISIN